MAILKWSGVSRGNSGRITEMGDGITHYFNYVKNTLDLGSYRMDNRDIFALCDDNVIYEIYLKDAINRDLLAPFRYYGIYDETDYTQVEYRSGKYVVDDLERQLSREERAGLVLEKYKSFAGGKTLAFCVSINHANYMAQYFNRHKVPSAAVHSGPAGKGPGAGQNRGSKRP